MSFIAPNGDVFNSKEDYDKISAFSKKQQEARKTLNVSVINARSERSYNVHKGGTRKKTLCKRGCGRVENEVTDYRGDKMCVVCFRNSL